MAVDHLRKEGYKSGDYYNMARYTGPRLKICRRLEFAAFESAKFGNPRKNYPPGQHGMSRRRKLSNYGVQLREKQRMKYLYEILEKQFRNYYKKAQSQNGPTGENLVILLESRLDNTIYRVGFASTRRAARQLVVHRHFLVNNKIVNIPSYQLKPGDEISVRDKSRKMEVFQESIRRIKGDNPTEWLSLNKAKLTGSFLNVPERSQIEEPFDEQLVIELYSK